VRPMREILLIFINASINGVNKVKTGMTEIKVCYLSLKIN